MNKCTHINQLPPELLTRILSFCKPQTADLNLLRAKGLITKTHVCSHWRYHMLACPELWDTILVFDEHRGQELLRRSQDFALRVSIGSPQHRFSISALEATLACMPRIVELIFLYNASIFDYLAAHFQTPAAQLKTILLRGYAFGDSPDGYLRLPDGFFDGQAPQLRSIALFGCRGIEWSSPLFRGLVVLSLRDIWPSNRVSVPMLLQILQQSPAMERLEAIRALSDEILLQPSSFGLLSNKTAMLRIITIILDDVISTVLHLLRQIQTPLLARLSVSTSRGALDCKDVSNANTELLSIVQATLMSQGQLSWPAMCIFNSDASKEYFLQWRSTMRMPKPFIHRPESNLADRAAWVSLSLPWGTTLEGEGVNGGSIAALLKETSLRGVKYFELNHPPELSPQIWEELLLSAVHLEHFVLTGFHCHNVTCALGLQSSQISSQSIGSTGSNNTIMGVLNPASPTEGVISEAVAPQLCRLDLTVCSWANVSSNAPSGSFEVTLRKRAKAGSPLQYLNLTETHGISQAGINALKEVVPYVKWDGGGGLDDDIDLTVGLDW